MAGVSKDTLHNPLQLGPTQTSPLSTHAWIGRTTLSSGSAAVTVTTAHAASDMVVKYGSVVGSVGVGANSGGAIVVNSVVAGTSFAFARATGVAVPWDEVIMWELVRLS